MDCFEDLLTVPFIACENRWGAFQILWHRIWRWTGLVTSLLGMDDGSALVRGQEDCSRRHEKLECIVILSRLESWSFHDMKEVVLFGRQQCAKHIVIWYSCTSGGSRPPAATMMCTWGSGSLSVYKHVGDPGGQLVVSKTHYHGQLEVGLWSSDS